MALLIWSFEWKNWQRVDYTYTYDIEEKKPKENKEGNVSFNQIILINRFPANNTDSLEKTFIFLIDFLPMPAFPAASYISLRVDSEMNVESD